MRPDRRSFSFTWLKGQQNQNEQNRPNTRSVTGSSPNQQAGSNSMHYMNELASGTGKVTKKEKRINKKELYGCNPSKFKLLKGFGTSLFSHSAKSKVNPKAEYSTIQEGQTDDDDDEEEEVVGKTISNSGITNPNNENAKPESDENDAEGGNDDVSVSEKRSLRSTTSKVGISKRVNQTVQDVKTSLGNISQKFRRSTRRRYRMTTPLTSANSTPTRKALGRTPTKLYSPFSFADSPLAKTTPLQKTPKRLQRPSTPRLQRKVLTPVQTGLAQAYSPNGTFQRDVQDMRRGFQELQFVSKNITRRNFQF